ncbi:uncharacterized protein [Palaemon carinicauda]|uniref:uncharacterized protein n=1 Tax=Palaemon carinicauda TaxID=392227 RepID=UPI0035B5AE81
MGTTFRYDGVHLAYGIGTTGSFDTTVRVLGYVILEQLVSHLEVIEALPDDQSAYRKLYSTERAICSVVNDMLVIMDEINCGILILLDLCADFDAVMHELLLSDLRSIGVEDRASEYLEDYLVGYYKNKALRVLYDAEKIFKSSFSSD